MSLNISLDQIAQSVSAEVQGDRSVSITGAQTLEKAEAGHISFLADSAHVPRFKTCKATAILVSRKLMGSLEGKEILQTLLIVDDAKLAFIQFLKLFSQPKWYQDLGIATEAIVHPSARLGKGTNIRPGAIIGEEVVIGDDCEIHSGACVGPGSRIGNHSILYPNVVLYPEVTIGERVIIHAGAVIGADGFSYKLTNGVHEKIPHFGTVHIEDDVEIGANTTIDRAFVGATRIGRGTRIDNLVQVAHNCELGPHNLLAGQVGMAGSVTTGEYVVCGGQVGVVDHVYLGDKAMFAARTLVTKSVAGNTVYYGTPAQPKIAGQKQVIAIRKLPQMREKIRELSTQIQALEAQLKTYGDLLNTQTENP